MSELTPYHQREIGLNKPFNLFDSFLANFYNDAFMPSFYSGQMKVDIKENEKNYIIEAELPGIKKEDIGIALDNNLLTISVEQKVEVNEENEHYIRKERRYGTTRRSFAVDNIDEDKISAKYENGILSLVLPKKNPTARKTNRINIQ